MKYDRIKEQLKQVEIDSTKKLHDYKDRVDTDERLLVTEKISLRSEVMKLTKEREGLRSELIEARAKCDALEVQTRKLLDDTGRVARYAELESKCIVLEHDKKKLISYVDQLINNKKSIENDMSMYEEKNAELKVRLKDSIQENRVLEVTLAHKLLENEKGLKFQLNEMNKKNSKLNNDLDTYKNMANTQKRKFLACQTLNKELLETVRSYEQLFKDVDIVGGSASIGNNKPVSSSKP